MQTVLATFDDSQDALAAVDQLLARGFTRTQIHVQSAVVRAAGGAAAEPAESRGVMSSVGNFFSTLFGAENESHAANYSEAVRRGSSVVAVDAESDAEAAKATAVLNTLGSVDVEERAARWKSEGWTGFHSSAGILGDEDAAFAAASIPVVQENFHVGKREVDVGGLRVIKRLTETPVSQVIKLRQEHATIERRTVDRPATEADFANFGVGTVEVREMAEEAVVGKSARVVEEVHVGRDVTETSQTLTDCVRGTEVEVTRVAPLAADVDHPGGMPKA